MEILENTGLCYDDVLIKPQYSEILPTETSVKTRLSKNINLNIPILSSAMDTVTDSKMAISMAELGGLGVIHKNLTISKHCEEVKAVKDKGLLVGAAIGVSEQEILRALSLRDVGVDVLVIDTAHGHTKGVLETLKILKIKCTKQDIIVGNIATAEAAKMLVESGADAVKIGIGPGSICTTRIVAGVGVPQFQALLDCSKYLKTQDIPFIADGGIRYSGDIVKALATGASTVMLGSLLASTDESASENVYMGDKLYKRYRGMGSLTAMGEGSKDRYGQSEIKDNKKLVPEGIEGLIPSRGSLGDFLHQLVGGLKSGLGYVGAKNLEELHTKASFIKVSAASLKENHPHNITIDIGAPNYTAS